MRVMLSARTVLHPIAHQSHYCFHGFMGLSSFTYKAGKYLPMGKSRSLRLAPSVTNEGNRVPEPNRNMTINNFYHVGFSCLIH